MRRGKEGVWFEQVALIRVIDGDTLIVRPRGFTSEVRVRLLDCWCEELNSGSPEEREQAHRAWKFSESRCEINREHLTLHVPFPKEALGIWDGLMKALSFGRVHGHIWLDDDHTLEESLIKHGLALLEKPADKPEKEWPA